VDEIVWSYNTFTGEQAFHQYDARGHCTLLTDSGGNVLEQYEFDAFGWPHFYNASGNEIGAYDPVQNLWEGYSQFGNRFLFTGREWISDLKVYDYRNRMYQPELGRFLQPDPKEFAAGDYNLYRYCHNDPINKSDPFGLVPPGDGLIDLPKDVLEKMYKDNRQNNTEAETKPDHLNGKPLKQEYRRDGFRTKDGLRSNSRKGYRDNTQPKNAPPKNIFGKAPRTSITHSHITGSFRHLPHDRDVADDAHVPSGVGYIGDNGAHMEIYVPKADGNGRGGTFYTDDGVHVYDTNGNPAPH
jgi:RHS repeat-associated protein